MNDIKFVKAFSENKKAAPNKEGEIFDHTTPLRRMVWTDPNGKDIHLSTAFAWRIITEDGTGYITCRPYPLEYP
jgi:hypothetical protein